MIIIYKPLDPYLYSLKKPDFLFPIEIVTFLNRKGIPYRGGLRPPHPPDVNLDNECRPRVLGILLVQQRFKTHRCNKHHLDEKSLQNSLSRLSSGGNLHCFLALANTEQIQAMLELLRCNRLGQHVSWILRRMHLLQ